MRNNLNHDMNNAMLQEQRRRRRRKLVSTAMAWGLVLAVIIAVVFCVVTLVMAAGGRSLRKQTTTNRPNLMLDAENTVSGGDTSTAEGTDVSAGATAAEPTAAPVVWQEGWVRHDGKIYEYNEDIMTIMVLGIDDMDKVTESTTLTGGGQSDANFLVIINPDEKDIKVLAINRDTMTEIKMYGAGEGGSTPIAYAQLATQHGFGDGKELSCELTRDTISALLYDLPIHGYASINMGAIAELNDAIGGVEVTVLDDITAKSKNLKKGAEVTLKGMDAFWYVKYRDTNVFESNRGRLARQKQYLTAFTAKLKEAVKKDITLPITIYQQLSPYIVTDLTIDEMVYLAKELLDYQLNGEVIYTLEGTTEMGEKFEEFYPDKDALKALMIELFYQEVEIE